MYGYLIKNNSGYICSNCRMRQPSVTEVCHFCSTPFSNFEDIILELYNDLTYGEISDIINTESEGKSEYGEEREGNQLQG